MTDDRIPTYPEIEILKLSRRQIWPQGKRLVPTVLDDRNPLMDKSTPVSSMGSCFASEIRTWLINNGYNYLSIGEEAYRQTLATLWGVVYNTFTMRQEIERGLEDSFRPVEATWTTPEGMIQCPYRKIPPWLPYKHLTELDEYQQEVVDYPASCRTILTSSKVFILTLGLTEIWYSHKDGSVFYQVPPKWAFDPNKHAFRTATYAENLENLTMIGDLMKKHNPDCTLVVTVSPVPLRATFRKDESVLTANSRSKATLLAVAREFVETSDNAVYFPSYEMLTTVLGTRQGYKDDNIHPTLESVEEIMQLFQRCHVS